MKRIVLAIAAALMMFSANGFAQGKYGADSAECVLHLSYYREYFKQKNYTDALPNWRNAYRVCPPTATENLLINGSTLLGIAIQKASADQKAAIVDSLLKLQDERVAFYPKNAEKALRNKAGYIANYLQNDPERAHTLYSEIIDRLGTKCDPSTLENDMRAVIQVYNAGKMDPVEVMNQYTKLCNLLSEIVPATDADKEKLSSASSNIQGLFATSKVADCNELQKIFGERLAADPENLSLIKSIVSILNTAEDCTGNDLYLKAVVAMNAMEPSAASAYALYRMNAARGNVSDAAKYLDQALAYEDLTEAQRNEYTLDLAKVELTSGNRGKAVSCAQKVANADPSKAGEAYMVIAKAWASANCGGDEIHRCASYWVATDYLQKAKNADPSVAAEANSLIGRYSAYFPQAADAFMYGVTAGQSYSVSCSGMSATTTVRTRK